MRLPRLSMFIFGVAVIVVGALPLLYARYRLNLHNWAPLTMPIPLITGEVKTPEFVPDYTGLYVVTLAFDGTDKGRKLCLIGDRLFKDSCTTFGGGLGLVMTVDAGDRVIVDHRAYQPYAFGGGDDISTELGRFEGTAKRQHSIALTDIRMAPELIAAHPKLKVDVHWAAWEQWVILEQLGFWVAIPLGVAGLACMLIATVFMQR